MTPAQDTRLAAQRALDALMRQAPHWRKLDMLGQLSQTTRDLALRGLALRYPNDTPAQLRRRLADLVLGKELAARAYGPLSADQNSEAQPDAH